MQTKLPKVGTTIFTTMSQMANQYQAINLSQGFPNFPIDPLIEDLLAKNSKENVHQYAPMAGLPVLLEGIAQMVHRVYQRDINPSTEILVTSGATQGIFATLQALVHRGDEVVILDPAYDCYSPAVHLAGGKPVHIPMREDFTIDWRELRQTVNQKTRVLIINNPHNPSGKMMDKEDFDALVQVMIDHPNLILCSDEVYEFITFEKKHFSAHNHEILRNRSVIVSSFGKTFHITGWKVGYLIAPEYILKEIKKVHQYLVFSVNSVAQKTLADYISGTDVTTLGKFYQDKRDRFKELMAKSKFEFLPSEGTYFQTVRYNTISNLPDVAFCEWMVKEMGVAAIPLSVFYEERNDYHTIRFCFAKTDETLIQAAERLCKI
ncbi:methionine aminotransferase [Fluviicola chungangensis]|uniref:Aminotransferase class I/II-fold pyridoxal phosphate-dependent enzyme n=1 Tax=Fluviicola chungangensis TaxID=2597671 RepID=A0A556N2E4_9FLAO|nr:methionine aminotransferase [Fluviicola chungangensis]TSJ46275.1 aminotransferase class I/II-fold pyridoxal phosphate-dependent enzyme [Fluviicola chungangensis]